MADTKVSAETLVSAVKAAYKIYIVTDTGVAPDSGAATMTLVKDFLRDAFGVMNDTGASLVEAAIQSEMEAGASTTQAVTPGRQHYHPSAAKVWGNATVAAGTPTLQSSYNVTSIADTATGRLTVTIATDFSSANYAVAVHAAATTTEDEYTYVLNSSIAAGSFEIRHANSAAALADPLSWQWVAFGDQA